MNDNRHPKTDDQNPAYIFQRTDTRLLAQIASGEIDGHALACNELANRGQDRTGKWVGFKEAASHAKPWTDVCTVELTVPELCELHKMAYRDFRVQEFYRAQKSKKWEANHGAGNLAPDSVGRHAREDAALLNRLAAQVEKYTKGREFEPVVTLLAAKTLVD